MENKKIYVYRYLWTEFGSTNLCVKIISGVEAEHNAFIEALKKEEKVEKCSRVYLHEYDLDKIENPEILKNIDKENE